MSVPQINRRKSYFPGMPSGVGAPSPRCSTRVKTPKRVFDPSDVATIRTRRKTLTAQPAPVGQLRLALRRCDHCHALLANERFVVCHLCLMARAHRTCVCVQPSGQWSCGPCGDIIDRWECSAEPEKEVALVTESDFTGFEKAELRQGRSNMERVRKLLLAAAPIATTSTTDEPTAPVDTRPPNICRVCSLNPDGRPATPFGHANDWLAHAGHWTQQQVFEYFDQHFPASSYVIHDAEIDGIALLLMTRNDMLALVNRRVTDGVPPNGAPLSLGVALKMYAHVARLQAHVARAEASCK